MKQQHGHKEGRSSELANAKERQRRATRRIRRREERREQEVKRTSPGAGKPVRLQSGDERGPHLDTSRQSTGSAGYQR